MHSKKNKHAIWVISIFVTWSVLLTGCDTEVETNKEGSIEQNHQDQVSGEGEGQENQSVFTAPTCAENGWDDVSYEPNDQSCQAFELQVNADQPFTSSLTETDKTDWFALNLYEGEKITLEITELSGSAYGYANLMYANLTKPDGTLLIQDLGVEERAQRYMDFTAPQTGTYYLTLTTEGNLGHGYQIEVFTKDRELKQDALNFEPNNANHSAFEIVKGEQYISQITWKDPIDVYEIPVSPGETVTISIDELSTTVNSLSTRMYWTVVDNTGLTYRAKKVVVRDETNTATITVIEATQLFIELSNPNSNHVYKNVSNSYQLVVNG